MSVDLKLHGLNRWQLSDGGHIRNVRNLHVLCYILCVTNKYSVVESYLFLSINRQPVAILTIVCKLYAYTDS